MKFHEDRFEELSGTDRDAEDWGSIKSYKDMIQIVNELKQEHNLQYDCVDCDECMHRSEDCLCDISNNEETCPLSNHRVYENRIEHTSQVLQFILDEYRDGKIADLERSLTYCLGKLNGDLDEVGIELDSQNSSSVVLPLKISQAAKNT